MNPSLSLASALLGLCLLQSGLYAQKPAPAYPAPRTVAQTDTYFSQAVEVPYRWLEDQYPDGVKQWANQQHNFTEGLDVQKGEYIRSDGYEVLLGLLKK